MNQFRQDLSAMNSPLQDKDFQDRLIDNLPPKKYKVLQVQLLQQRQNNTLTIDSFKTQVQDYYTLDSPTTEESPIEKLFYTPPHTPANKLKEEKG